MNREITYQPAAQAEIAGQVKPTALGLMAQNLNVDPAKLLSTLKNTVFKGATDDELLALVVVANTYGLSPLLKELYAFPAKGGGIVPVVSIDGWISMINRQSQLDGIEFAMSADGEECTCRIYVKGRNRPVEVTEYKSECFRNSEPWKTMPKRMLRHKALIQCARVAFGFSGIYDEDEATRIAAANTIQTVTTKTRPTFEAIEAKAEPDAIPMEFETVEAPASEPTQATLQDRVSILIADCSIATGTLMGWLAKRKVFTGKAVWELPDNVCEDLLKNWNDYQRMLEVYAGESK